MTKFSKLISEVKLKGEVLPDGTNRYESGGTIFYRKNGKRHRIGGPAIASKDGNYEAWYVDDKLHRTDGPAIIDRSIGHMEWYVNGLPHRTDGPAYVSKKVEMYWINGKKISKEEFEKHFG